MQIRLLNALVLSASLCLSAVAAWGAQQQGLGYSDTPIIPGTEWHVHDGKRPQPRGDPGHNFSLLAPRLRMPSCCSMEKTCQVADRPGWRAALGRHEWVFKPAVAMASAPGKWADFRCTWNSRPRAGQRQQPGPRQQRSAHQRHVKSGPHSFNNLSRWSGRRALGKRPLVNAKPQRWQATTSSSSRRVGGLNLVKKANVTVLQRPRHTPPARIHRRPMASAVPHTALGECSAASARVFIELQDHGNPVRYRTSGSARSANTTSHDGSGSSRLKIQFHVPRPVAEARRRIDSEVEHSNGPNPNVTILRHPRNPRPGFPLSWRFEPETLSPDSGRAPCRTRDGRRWIAPRAAFGHKCAMPTETSRRPGHPGGRG
jgi:hypothetical protein